MKYKQSDGRAVHINNRAATINLIRDSGPISKPQIGRRLGISLATVQRIVSDLLREDLVYHEKTSQNLVGRPSDYIRFNGEAHTVAGIDLGRNKMLGMVSNLSGEIKYEREINYVGNNLEDNYIKLCEIIDDVIHESEKLKSPLAAIGLGIPGIIDIEKGVVISSPDLGWDNFPLLERLIRQYQTEIFIERDINLIALGEHGFGVGRGYKDIICVTLGRFMSCPMIINGQLNRGNNYRAGSLGYMIPSIQDLGYHYDIDKLGALAERSSSTTVLRRAKEVLESNGNFQLSRQITPQMVYEAARNGEDWALPIIEDVIQYTALVVANLAVVYDPELIIISGNMSESAGFIVEPILEKVGKCIPWKPKVVVSNLGTKATALGALMMIYENIILF